jgi:hypothetical protein
VKKGSFVSELRRSSLGLLALLLVGCVGNTSGQLTLPKEQVKAGTYFVQRHDKDTRDLAATIAEAMQVRGLSATAGTAAELPAEATYVVTYVDKWVWDMRMYLYDLRIDLRDARDQSILGYGQSMQSSLKAMGQTHEDVINRALDQLFPPGK